MRNPDVIMAISLTVSTFIFMIIVPRFICQRIHGDIVPAYYLIYTAASSVFFFWLTLRFHRWLWDKIE